MIQDTPHGRIIRDEKGRFLKGMTTTGGGRKAIPQEVRKILECATVDAAEFLVNVIKNENEKTEHRIRASEIVMDRIWGKVKQQVDATIESNITTQIDLSGLSVDQLLKIANMDVEKDVIDVNYCDVELENNSDENTKK